MPAETAPRPLKAFLCHARPDKAAVRDLYRRLKSDGWQPWLDEEDLIPGEVWEEAIERAVRSTDVVVVCLSTQSITREGYVQREIAMALRVADEKPEGTIFLIPARLEDCRIPDRISRFHGVDLWRENGYKKLRESLRIRGEHLGLGQPESRPQMSLTLEPTRPYILIVVQKHRTRGAFVNFDCTLTNVGEAPLTIHRLQARLTDPFNASFVFDWNLFYKTEGLVQSKQSDARPITLAAGEVRAMGVQFVAPPSISQYTWDSGRYSISILGWVTPGQAGRPDLTVPFEAFVSPADRERLKAWCEEYEAVQDPDQAVGIPVQIRAASRPA